LTVTHDTVLFIMVMFSAALNASDRLRSVFIVHESDSNNIIGLNFPIAIELESL